MGDVTGTRRKMRAKSSRSAYASLEAFEDSCTSKSSRSASLHFGIQGSQKLESAKTEGFRDLENAKHFRRNPKDFHDSKLFSAKPKKSCLSASVFGRAEKSQAKPLFTLLVCIIVVSSAAFAEEYVNATNETADDLIKQITRIIGFFFSNNSITAMLVLENDSPVAGEELRFYENESALSFAITNESGATSIDYFPENGEHNISVLFIGTENLSASNLSGTIAVNNSKSEAEIIAPEENAPGNSSDESAADKKNASDNTANISANITVEEYGITQGMAEIDKPVTWTKKLSVKNNAEKDEAAVVNISIDSEAENVRVEDEVLKKEVMLSEKGGGIGASSKKDKKDFEFAGNLAPLEQKEYTLTYATPAPEKLEDQSKIIGAEWKKRVVIYSNHSYKNVLSHTDIIEAASPSIHLFWNVSGSLADVTGDAGINLTYSDTNGNGKIDHIYWTVPHLSEQEFVVVVNLTVLNVQSYPTVGGTWTVRFTTTGTANLTISAIDGTLWSNDAEDKDLKFLELKCGEEIIPTQWANNSVFAENYACNETGYEISKVLTPGKHHLMFKFGDDTEFANNLAGCTLACDTGSSGNVCLIGSAKDVLSDCYIDDSVLGGSYNSILINGTGSIYNNTNNASFAINVTGNITIKSGGKIQGNVNISAVNLTIESGGLINASGMGYVGGTSSSVNGKGPGGGTGNSGDYNVGGGAYGGDGGDGASYPGGNSYGNLTNPDDFGSGGGTRLGGGGNGGGLVRLNISGTLENNGTINASGFSVSGASWSAGGAGGGIYISTWIFAGNGTITSIGGNAKSSTNAPGGGGGGRIAIYYTSRTFSGTMDTYGGSKDTGSGQWGGAGTIYLQKQDGSYKELIIDNNGNSGANTPLNASAYSLAFDSVTIRSAANVTTVLSLLTLNATTLSGNGTLYLGANNLSLRTSNISMSGGNITSTSGQINITANGSIILPGRLSTSSGTINIWYGSTGTDRCDASASTISGTANYYYAPWSNTTAYRCVNSIVLDNFNLIDSSNATRTIVSIGEAFYPSVRIREFNGTNYFDINGNWNMTTYNSNGSVTNGTLNLTNSSGSYRWINRSFTESSYGSYSFYANITGISAVGMTNSSLANFYSYLIKTISITENLNATLVNPQESVSVSGTTVLMPENINVTTTNNLSVWLDGALLASIPPTYTWLNSSWPYRKAIIVNNTQNSNNLTDYQVPINITWNSHMNGNFSDLRFSWYNSTSETELETPYWIEDNVTSGWAYAWIKVPFVNAGANATVYAYYGNASLSYNNSLGGNNTFVFFDDFEGSTLNTAKWNTSGYASFGGVTYSISSGILKSGNPGDGSWKALHEMTAVGPSDKIVFYSKQRIINTSVDAIIPAGYADAANNDANRYGIWVNPASVFNRQSIIGAYANYSSLPAVSFNTWFTTEFIRTNASMFKLNMYYSNRTLFGSDTYDNTSWSGTSFWWNFYVSHKDAIEHDFVLARKYAASEPSVIFSSAEENVSAPLGRFNSYNYTFAAPLTAGNHAVKVNLTDSNGIYGSNSTNLSVRINLSSPNAKGVTTGTTSVNANEAVNLSVTIPASNINSSLLNLSKVWANISWAGSSQIVFLSGNVAGGTWWNNTFSSSTLGQYNVTFYANLTDGFATTTVANATFNVKQLNITHAINDSVIYATETALINGTIYLEPEHAASSTTPLNITLNSGSADAGGKITDASGRYNFTYTPNAGVTSITNISATFNAMDSSGINGTTTNSSAITVYPAISVDTWATNASCASRPSAINEVPTTLNDTGLVGYWRFNSVNASGYTADDSGRNNNGYANGSALTPSGKFGAGMQFDGVDDYVDAGNGESLNITNAITIEAWVKPSIKQWQHIIRKQNAGGDDYSGYSFYLNGDGNDFTFTVSNTTGTGNYKQIGGILPGFAIGVWNNIVLTYDATDGKLRTYNNGMAGITGDFNKTIGVNSYDLFIGSSSPSAAFFNGTIDEVRIYNRSLSAEEIAQHYNRTALSLCANVTYGASQAAGAYVNFSVNDTGSYNYGAANPVHTVTSVYDAGTIVSTEITPNESTKYTVSATAWNPTVSALVTAQDAYSFTYGELNISANLSDSVVMPDANITITGKVFDWFNELWIRIGNFLRIFLDGAELTNGGHYNKTWTGNADFSNGTSVNATNSSNMLVLDPRGEYYFEAEKYIAMANVSNLTNDNPSWDGEPSGGKYIGNTATPWWTRHNITGVPNGTYYIFLKLYVGDASYMVNVTWDGAYINTTQRSAGYVPAGDILWSDNLRVPVTFNSTSHVLGINSTANSPGIDVILITTNASFVPDDTDQNYTSTPMKYRGYFTANKTVADYSIISITPNWTSNEPAGANITIDISANNGASWCANVTKREYRANESCGGIGTGTELVWRANLSTNDSFAALQLINVTMIYETGNTTKTNSSGLFSFLFNALKMLGWHNITINTTDNDLIEGNVSLSYLVDNLTIITDTTPNIIDTDAISETISVTINSNAGRTTGARKNITATIINPDATQDTISNSSFSCSENYPMTCTASWTPGVQPLGWYNATVDFEDNESITGTNTTTNDFKVDNITTTLAYLPAIPILSTQNINVSGIANYSYDGSGVSGVTVNAWIDGSKASWWSDSWSYRKAITISSPSAITDYQINFSANWTSGMNTTFDDIRFASANGLSTETLIPYWIQNYTASANATVWVKANLSSGDNIVYMYYGNPAALNASNYDAVFTKEYNASGTNDTGLAGEWHFDAGSGTSAIDSSGYGNTGTLYNGTQVCGGNFTVNSSCPQWQSTDGGQWDNRSDVKFATGSALQFDGVDDYVNIPTFNFTNNYSTYEMWINRSNETLSDNVLSNNNYGSLFLIRSGSTINWQAGRLWVYYGDDSVGINSNAVLSQNKWYHIVITVDVNIKNVLIYIDGVLDSNTTYPQLSNITANGIIIGTLGGTGSFNGSIDEVRIYNRSLSADEIYRHYIRSKYASSGAPSVTSISAAEQSLPQTNSVGAWNSSFRVSSIGTHTLKVNMTDANGVSGVNATQIDVWAPSKVNATASDYALDIDDGSLSVTGYYWRTDVLGAIPGEINITINGYTQTCSSATSCQKTFTLGPGKNISSAGIYTVTINASNNSAYYMPNSTQFNISVDNITTTINTDKTLYLVGETISVNGTANYTRDGRAVQSNLVNVWIDNSKFNWWNASWLNRKAITISSLGSAATDYQTNFTLNWTSGMNTAFDDLRFTYIGANSEVAIPYWIQNYSAGSNATVWIKANLTNRQNTVYMYYNNPSASNASSYDNVFIKEYNATGANDTGLVGEWHFDAGSGTTAIDSSGFGNTGTLYNGTQICGGNSTFNDTCPQWQSTDGGQWDNRSDVKFATGSALQFDGVDDYVDAGNGASLNITNAITIEAWVKENSVGMTQGVVGKESIYKVDVNSGIIRFLTGNNWGGAILSSWDTVLSANSWYHIVVVYDGSIKKLYVNGIQDSNTVSTSGNLGTNTNNLQIGISDTYFNGTIDEVRIYNRSLSADEIYRHYIRSKYAAITTSSVSFGAAENVTMTNASGAWSSAFPAPQSLGVHALKANLTDVDVIYGENATIIEIWAQSKVNYTNSTSYAGTNTEYNITGNYFRTDKASDEAILGLINITVFNSTYSLSKSCSGASSCLKNFTIGPSGELKGGNYTVYVNATNNSAYYMPNSTVYNIYLEEPKATPTLNAPIKVISDFQQGVDYNYTQTVTLNNSNSATMHAPRIDEVNGCAADRIAAIINATPKDCPDKTPNAACIVQFNITVSGQAPQGQIGCLSWKANWTNNDNTVGSATNTAFYIDIWGNPKMNASVSMINITDYLGSPNTTLITINNTGNTLLGAVGVPADSIFVDLVNSTIPSSWVGFISTSGVWNDAGDYWDYLTAGNNHVLNVTITAGNYTAGTYTGVINITSYSSGALQTYAEINMSMTVSPNISISQNLINHTQYIGSPNITNITVAATGNSPITNVTATYIAESMPTSWISFSSNDSAWNASTRSLSIITEHTNKTLIVNITALSYAPGTYTGKINITTNEYLDRLINVSVTISPAISANISLMNITQNISSANTTLVSISSTGNAPITNVTIALANSTIPQSWVSLGSTAGDWNSSTNSFLRIDEATSRTLNITIKATNYTEGTYTGILNITSNENQNTQVNLSIAINPNATTYNINSASEHGRIISVYHIINSTGNAPLINATATYSESTLPASWVTLNYSGQSGQSVSAGNITEGAYKNITIEITIPQFQDPGNYVGYMNITFDNEPTQQATITLTVNTNSSWYIQSPVNRSNTFVLGQAGVIGNVTIVNTGNVPLNYTVTYAYNGVCQGNGAAPYYCTTGGLFVGYNNASAYAPKNSIRTFGIWQKGDSSTETNAEIIVNVTNSSGTPTYELAYMSWNITNSPPALVNLTTLPKNYAELNKSIALYAAISDDEALSSTKGLNMTSVYFNVTTPTGYVYTIDNNSIYAWTDNDYVPPEADRRKFNYSFANTSATGIHNLTVHIKDKSGNEINRTVFQFEVVGATYLNVTASAPSSATNVTMLHGQNLTVPVNITNLGRAAAYNLTVTGIFANGTAWNSTFSELNESQSIQTNITLEINAGTRPDSIPLTPKVIWMQPNATQAENITSYNVTVTVASKYEITMPANQATSMNHGAQSTLQLGANATGNVDYGGSPYTYMIAGTAPAGWVCFNNYCASGGVSAKSQTTVPRNTTRTVTVYISVPSGTSPGNYTFQVKFNSTNDPSGSTSNVTITVLEDRSWSFFQPYNQSAFELNIPGIVGVITLNGSGNIETNFTINYSNWSATDYHSYSGLFNESQNNSGTIINPKSIILQPNELKNITIYHNGYFQGISNIGINVTLSNSSASPAAQSILLAFNLTETAPNITAITFSNASYVELNKTIGIKIHARDDAALNLSTIRLNITNPLGTSFIYTPANTSENQTAYGKYTKMNFTQLFNSTSVAGTYTVNASVSDEYGYTALSSQYIFEVIGNTTFSLSSNATSYNASGISQASGRNITTYINASNIGVVDAYSVALGGNMSSNASTWIIYGNSIGNVSASSNASGNVTIYIPEKTWPGTYYFTPKISWTQPSGSAAEYYSSPHSIIVASNRIVAFTEYSLNYTISHGITNSTPIRINSTGNDNATSITLWKQNVPSNLTVSLNQSSISGITAGESKYVLLNITPIAGAPNNTYTFSIRLDNDGATSATYNYAVVVPASFSWSKNVNQTTVNGVSGQNAMDTSVNITNNGNNPITLTFSLSGNVSDGTPPVMSVAESPKTLQPLETYAIKLNHTAKNENAYYAGTLEINNGTTYENVAIDYYSYIGELNIANISPNYNVLSGNSINVTTQLIFGANNITENTTYAIAINGTSCSIGTSTPSNGYMVHTCTAPSIPDGKTYNVQVNASYQFTTGVVPLTTTNASAIYYKDVTAPNITSHSITAEQEVSKDVSISLTAEDNVGVNGGLAELKYPNSTAYRNITVFDTDPSLVLYLPFNKGSGTSAYDHSLHGNDGTLTNMNLGIDNCTGNCSGWTTSGKFGNGMQFDGVNDYVNAGNGASLRPQNGTYAAWIKMSALPTDGNVGGTIFTNYGGNQGLFFSVLNNGKLHLRIHNGSISQPLTSIATLAVNTWYYVVGVVDGNVTRIYINSQLDTTLSDILYIPGSSNEYIGAWGGGSAFYFNGTIDEVRIYNRSLNASEIEAHYNATAGRYGSFTAPSTVGIYTAKYYVNDTTGNMNSSITNTFEIYEWKNFSGIITDLNSNPISVAFNVTNSSGSNIAQFQTNSSGNYNATLKKKTYNLNMSFLNSTIELTDVDFSSLPSDFIDIDQPMTGDYGYQGTVIKGFAVNTSLSANGNITMTYTAAEAAGRTTDYFQIYKCVNWDYANRNCLGGLSKLTSTHDKINRKLKAPISTMTTFILVEDQPVTRPEMTISASTLPMTVPHGKKSTGYLTIQSTGTVALSDIQFTCSSGTVCTNFTFAASPIIGLDAGASYDAPINITVPQYYAPGIYEGTLTVESNKLSVYAQYKALTLRVTVQEDNNWTASANLSINEIGSSTSGVAGNIELKNYANVPISFTVSPNTTYVTATPTEITIAKNNTDYIAINYTTPRTVNFYNYSINITGTVNSSTNSSLVFMAMNITHAVNITTIQPRTDIIMGQLITINATASYLGVLQTENISWEAFVDDTPCTSVLSSYNSTNWMLTCEAPNMSAKLSYTLKLKGTFLAYNSRIAYDAAYDQDNIYYVDVLPPQIVNLTPSAEQASSNVTINTSITDYSNITGANVTIIAPNGTALATINLTKITNITYTIQYNFTEIGDYILRYTVVDSMNNTGTEDKYFEIYRNMTFSGKVARGDGSGLETTFKLYRQNQSFSETHRLQQFATSSAGSYNATVHFRTYDLEAGMQGNTIRLYGVNLTSYNSDPIDVDIVSGNQVQITGTTEMGGIAVNTSIAAGGKITLAYVPTASTKEDNIYIYRCANWNYTDVKCAGTWEKLERKSGDLDKINNKISVDISGFSAYVAAEVTPPIPVDITGSVSVTTSGGGGGGGGSSKDYTVAISEIKQKITTLIEGTSEFSVDTKSISKQLYPGERVNVAIGVKNSVNTTVRMTAKAVGDFANFSTFGNSGIDLGPQESGTFSMELFIPKNAYPGNYEGKILVNNGKVDTIIPVSIRILDSKSLPITIDVQPLVDNIAPGATERVKLGIINTGASEIPINYTVSLVDPLTGLVITEIKGAMIAISSESIYLNFSIPENITLENPQAQGFEKVRTKRYMIKAAAFSSDPAMNIKAESVSFISVTEKASIFEMTVWGVPAWIMALAVVLSAAGYIGRRKYLAWASSKKKYVETIDFKTLPQATDRSGFIGKIAETEIRAFVDLDTLQTHTVLAGATGGGKTVAAQVIVEEALLKGVAVIVFDPTAQWSGFLRPNRDKKMLKMYRNFNMKVDDSRAFNGNVYEIRDPRQLIDITKYMKSGEITIFTMNHLDTKDIDFFVANTVSQVFQSGLDGSQKLRLLIVYDEVHRLLAKYGGTGNGFIQIERAVREFRKWGIGLVLISQVLSDFIGTIKANIGTDIQLRTRDENDLDRIKLKYGEDMMRSIVKTGVGEAMLENAQYNKGKPYFVAFRPLLHSIDRLPDAELEKYSKYNAKIDDLKYQLEYLKSETVDVFDLELELKLTSENLMKGKFNMVDIYLEELEPKVMAIWKKLGREPKRMIVSYATREEIEKDVEQAKRERENYIRMEKAEEERKKKAAPVAQKAGGAAKEASVLKSDEHTASKPRENAAHHRGHERHDKKDIESIKAAVVGDIRERAKKEDSDNGVRMRTERKNTKENAANKKIEEKGDDVRALYESLKEKMSESKRKGVDVSVAALKSITIPSDIKLAVADENPAELRRIEEKIRELMKKL